MTGYANVPLRVTLGEAALADGLARCAASVLVRQRLSAPSLAEIAFAEPPKTVMGAARFGASLRLSIRDGSNLFDGELTVVEQQRDGAEGRIVRLRAYDRLHRLRKRQRARTLANASIAQLARETVGDLGLDVSSTEEGPVRRLITQHDQSDLDLMVGLAAEAGLYLYLDGATLRLTSLAGEGEPIELRLGRELAEARATASIESMRQGTQAKGWDVSRCVVVSASAAQARQDARDLDVSAFEGLGARSLFNRLAADEGEARALAQADVDRSAAREIAFEAVAAGDPRIRPGQRVRISGFDNASDGTFTVTEAIHTFTEAEGYLTRFSTEPPRIAQTPPRGPIFTFGQVIDVDDPDRLSRIRTRLPLVGDIESDWLAVVVTGAGADKGLAILPEPDDDVLIVFPQGDLAHGLVLGGLFGQRQAPGQVGSGVRPFTLRTGNGQALTLDAAGGLVRIETSGGDALELGPNGTRLHATQDLVIEAPGRTLTIRAKAVEFEQS